MGEIVNLEIEKKHPYRDNLERTLNSQKSLLALLEKRMQLQPESQTEWSKNEHAILLFDTKGRIDSIKKSIQEKQGYFDKWIKQFAIDHDECMRDFDATLEKAKRLSHEIPPLKELLKAVKWDMVESNIEAKVALYKRIKKMI